MFDVVGRLVLDAAQADADAGSDLREVIDDAREDDDDGIGPGGDNEFALGDGGVELLAVEGVAQGVHRGADLPADAWQMTGEGTWQIQPGAPAVIIQEKSGATASAVQTLPGAGTIVWRCYVEPSPTCDAAGLWFAAAPDLSTGYRLTLGGNPGLGGVQLHDASGALCWEDKYAPWTYYTPYVLEGVAEAGRVRHALVDPQERGQRLPHDTLELARRAGLGWRGKHTLLLDRAAGSYFFLGEIYTDLPLPTTSATSAHCGTCTRCLRRPSGRIPIRRTDAAVGADPGGFGRENEAGGG